MDGGEFLQTSHAPKSLHRPLSPSKRQVRVLRAVVYLATGRLPVADAEFALRGAIRAQLVRHDLVGRAVALQRFPYEFQRGLLVARLRHEAFEHLALVIDRAPKAMSFTVDLRENLIEMLSPLWPCAQPFGPLFADLGGEFRAKSVPPEANGFMSDIDASFMEQVLHVPQRQRKPDVQHHCQTDDLGAGFELFEWGTFCHAGRVGEGSAGLKRSSSDTAPKQASPNPHRKPYHRIFL